MSNLSAFNNEINQTSNLHVGMTIAQLEQIELNQTEANAIFHQEHRQAATRYLRFNTFGERVRVLIKKCGECRGTTIKIKNQNEPNDKADEIAVLKHNGRGTQEYWHMPKFEVMHILARARTELSWGTNYEHHWYPHQTMTVYQVIVAMNRLCKDTHDNDINTRLIALKARWFNTADLRPTLPSNMRLPPTHRILNCDDLRRYISEYVIDEEYLFERIITYDYPWVVDLTNEE